MDPNDLSTAEARFFKRGNPLKKLLSVSLDLLGAKESGILYGTNETRRRFLPAGMWDRGIIDRFGGRGYKGLFLKLFGTVVVTARKLSPVYFYRNGPGGEQIENHGIIADVLRNYADYHTKGIRVVICPRNEDMPDTGDEDYLPFPFYVYDGSRIRRSTRNIKVDLRIVKHFKSGNCILIYLPDYGVLVINTVREDLLRMENGAFVWHNELTLRLDGLIRLVETASLAYLGQLKGKSGAELLWRKEKDLRRTALELAANEKRYRDLYENAPIAYFSIDPKGIIFRSNRQARLLSGYGPRDLDGRNIISLFAEPREASAAMASIREDLKAGYPIRDMEARMLSKSRQTVWVSLSIDAVKDARGGIAEVRVMALDISKRKSLEKQLLQAHKMEAIGTMASGIAHDFNNLLSPIHGCAQMLLMDLEKGTMDKKAVSTILECTRYAKELASQILTVGREKDYHPEVVDTRYVVEEALGLLRSVRPPGIEVRFRANPDCGAIKADPVQIRQVVMNLSSNAFHAMEEGGGVLDIVLSRVRVSPGVPGTWGMTAGTYARIEVADTGSGINPEIADKIFEPYFTTKDASKGSGIGLSVVHGIVDSHGGYIRVDHERKKGARFLIYLPVHDGPAPDAKQPAPPGPPTGFKGSGHVLVVDDDETVAHMYKRFLEKLGYRVTCCLQSPSALAAVAERPSGFHVMITDMSMPHLSGVDLIRKVADINPDLPVILCTGMGEPFARGDDCPPSVKDILSKPVGIQSLSLALKRVAGSWNLYDPQDV